MTDKSESEEDPRSASSRDPGAQDRHTAELVGQLEARISTLTRQIMGMERTLANMEALAAEVESAQEAIACAYQLLSLYRKRRGALLE